MRIVNQNVMIATKVIAAGTPVAELTAAQRAQLPESFITETEPEKPAAPLEPVVAKIEVTPAATIPSPSAVETMVNTPAEINPPPSWAKGKV